MNATCPQLQLAGMSIDCIRGHAEQGPTQLACVHSKVAMILVYLLTVTIAALGLIALFGSSSNFDSLRLSLTRYWVFIDDMDLRNEIKTHVQSIRSTLIKLQRPFLRCAALILTSLALVVPLKRTFLLAASGSKYAINAIVPLNTWQA